MRLRARTQIADAHFLKITMSALLCSGTSLTQPSNSAPQSGAMPVLPTCSRWLRWISIRNESTVQDTAFERLPLPPRERSGRPIGLLSARRMSRTCLWNAACSSTRERSGNWSTDLGTISPTASSATGPTPAASGTSVRGRKHWLCRPIDAEGDVLDILVQPRRNVAAERRFLKGLVSRFGAPRVIVTDKLRSYVKPIRELAPNPIIAREVVLRSCT